ncbi:MAG: ferrous iron transporter B [Cyanobacteriota bacterium]|nr:ferrous iron transporter B [Cyanobacteriota bacterium]
MKPSCHDGGAKRRRTEVIDPVRVALLGLPNTGKSTLFNALTGGHAQIANWPGLTVDLERGTLVADAAGRPYELVDLPGIHDLTGGSEDEAVVQRFLRHTPPDLILLVLNASQIASQLRLPLQLRTLGLPMVAVLNMSDEAQRFGLAIDHQGLTDALGWPVLPVSAKRRQGIGEVLEQVHRLGERLRVAEGAGSPRGFDELAGPGVPGVPVVPSDPDDLEALRRELVARFVRQPEGVLNRRSRAVDRVLLHPLVGVVVFLALVLMVFQLLYALAAPLQELLGSGLDGLQTSLLEPGLAWLGAPAPLKSFLIEGVWLGVGTVATFMPLIFLFYVLIGVIEDSGYLPRAAFLMDGFMRWLGLDGRSFVLQVMGFGCNVPSIMGTRVIRDRAVRLLAMLCIPFALCQARLMVFVFLVGVFFPRPWWAPGLVAGRCSSGSSPRRSCWSPWP